MVGSTGCSDSETATESTSAPAQPSGPIAVEATAGSGVSVGSPSSVSAPPPVAPPGAAAVTAVNIPSADNNGEVRTRDDNGNALDGENILKRALMQHVEGKGHPYPSRIEELVELGTLKSLPSAPDGKKWAIDPATRKIVLQ